MKPSTELLPNLFILGAAKAGTTTLYDLLQAYPEVYFSFEKEPAFFSDDVYYARGLDWYIRTFFRHAGGRPLRGEATPHYLFWGDKVAPRLRAAYPIDVPKLIAIFREPAELVYSMYWSQVRDGKEDLGFREALLAEPERSRRLGAELQQRGHFLYLYSRLANYASQLRPFLQAFPRSNFLFLLHHELRDTPSLARKLEAFLGLASRSWTDPVRSNRAALPRYPMLRRWIRETSPLKSILKNILPYRWRYSIKQGVSQLGLREMQVPSLDADLRMQLRAHFAPEIRQLEDLINMDLSAWTQAA